MSDFPIRVLAVLGSAAIGAFATGGLLRLAGRLTMTRGKLPVWIPRTLRGLGAIVLGWLAALWMFGSGLGGFGGPGGCGLGPGSGIANGTTLGTSDSSLTPKEEDKEKKKASESGP